MESDSQLLSKIKQQIDNLTTEDEVIDFLSEINVVLNKKHYFLFINYHSKYFLQYSNIGLIEHDDNGYKIYFRPLKNYSIQIAYNTPTDFYIEFIQMAYGNYDNYLMIADYRELEVSEKMREVEDFIIRYQNYKRIKLSIEDDVNYEIISHDEYHVNMMSILKLIKILAKNKYVLTNGTFDILANLDS